MLLANRYTGSSAKSVCASKLVVHVTIKCGAMNQSTRVRTSLYITNEMPDIPTFRKCTIQISPLDNSHFSVASESTHTCNRGYNCSACQTSDPNRKQNQINLSAQLVFTIYAIPVDFYNDYNISIAINAHHTTTSSAQSLLSGRLRKL
jgi:hypothetical protein